MLTAMLVLSNGAQLGGAIFCVSSGGQVDVETLVCACCAVSALHDERDHAESAPASSSCRDCVDVPIRVPPFKIDAPPFFLARIDAMGRTVTSACDGVKTLDRVDPIDRMGRYCQTLFHLSAVVILT